MSCTSPLKAFYCVNQRTGELGLHFDRDDIASFMKKDAPETSLRRLLIPCGQCNECRKDKAHKWADRLTLEATLHPGASWFVTLTYDDDHLPRTGKQILDRETGVVGDLPVVDMDHVSQFLKRLRSRLKTKVRFFAVTEYGESSRRPHAHLILFASLPDLRSFRPGSDGSIMMPPGVYFSQIVEDCWRFGGTTVQECNAWACSYVAGYVQKKLTGNFEKDYLAECAALGVDPQPAESARMSRRPGIAVPLLDRDPDLGSSGTVAVPSPDGAFAAPTPRVFERYLSPDAVETYKERRVASQDAKIARLMQLRPDQYIETLNKLRARVREKRARVRAQKL